MESPMNTLSELAHHLGAAARASAPPVAAARSGIKDAVLLDAARRLLADSERILAANAQDLQAGRGAGLSPAMLDRLELSEARLDAMAEGLRQVAALPDPVGQVLDGWTRPNGLRLHRVRVPLGVLLIIFESRPNVTVDAAALALKSGNAVILRGGREAQATNRALGQVLAASLAAGGLPADAVQVVGSVDRALVPELLSLSRYIDVVIPRGGKSLVRVVSEHAAMPVIKHLDGVCHVYVDAAAELSMAERIAVNAKAQRPGVCNAMETLLVHAAVAPAFLPRCLASLHAAGVELRGDGRTRALGGATPVLPASDSDWTAEYLELVLSVAVVDDLASAIAHINAHGSHHTDAIVTQDVGAAARFEREVDSSSVMVNASTRFSDGFEYGLGAEIGISTDKLHARGPVGLEGLTTYKWIVRGDGQVRS